MCGIVGLIGSREVSPLIIEGLRKLEYRGYDSAGLATIKTHPDSSKIQLTRKRAQGKLINLVALVDQEGSPGSLGIGHTRWATHGKPDEQNAHPHMDISGDIAVVQNGIIENHTFLKNQLIQEGVQFSSDTDTEVIPHLIARELNSLKLRKEDLNGHIFLNAVQKALLLLEGSYALAVICKNVPDALVIAKRQAPLIIGLGEGEFFCASDTSALAGFTRAILPMEDEEIALLTPLGIELYDSKGHRQQRSPSLLNISEFQIDRANFRHFMLKEIHEQPETAQLWIARHLSQVPYTETPVILPFEKSFYEGVEHIQILACGTSRHASMVGAYLLEQFSGIPTSVFYASEFRYAPPPLVPHTLTIGVTQSGETADTLAALAMERARRKKFDDPIFASRQLGITNQIESSLTREVSNIFDIGAGLEIGVAATKTFLAQLLAFYGLALAFAAERQTRSKDEIQQFVNELKNIPNHLRTLLVQHTKLSESLAHRFSNVNDVIFLGRGINYPIALEGALKLKEISYIHAEGYPAGEMKHGPIALLDDQVPVISIATPGLVFDKVISNSQEAKARDAKLIGIAPKGPDTEIFDTLFEIPEVSEFLSPLLTVLPTQLLSYHIAAHRGLDVDQPRNLAKSVTVE